MIDRRNFLGQAALGAGALLVGSHMALAAVETDRRFVFIIQRGAADGLAIVAPYADPAYARLRGALALDPAKTIRLDGSFALHPALAETAKMYAARQALFVHAVASPYRDRSHFDGQNVLETGGDQPYRLRDGWLNRLVALLPRARDEAVALAPTVPMALRGSAEVTSYAPSALPQPSDDLLLRAGRLYARDAQLHPLWTAALEARGLAEGSGARQDPASLGRLAASFLVKPNGPRIAMMETGGWDTHSGQEGRLAAQLKALDMLLAALRDGLGSAWTQTTVLVATEFGRTAAVNGTGGTDHGTASVAWLIGGAVRGGRLLTDWPGLAPGQLYEGRDLKPTLALDALIAGAAAGALALDPVRVARSIFPEATGLRPVEGLTVT
ncbi:DUF1501 domain-containing protein [Flavisphingomonas formosensis]|uniref:DUF1501 domain-containing protein n=1 Tax=Flavisphingomonas formosensis TaxID=861534 RepID=UPI0012FBB705|nr:DUF1501 domain-containing protein [Sphingomonas formosensis]